MNGHIERELMGVWVQVLQEVAAAHSVLIICGRTMVDGYAFCLGLGSLELTNKILVRPITYLLRDSIFRRGLTEVADTCSMTLGIRPLGELIDMYHDFQATDWRDRIYALLGMSSGDTTAFSPDYTISWKQLFARLVGVLFGRLVSIRTWDDALAAVIGGQGYVLGRISSVRIADYSKDQQQVVVASRNMSGQMWHEDFTLPASAQPIQEGDLVCHMAGAPGPIVIRPCRDHFWVVSATATCLGKLGGLDNTMSKPNTRIPSRNRRPHSFLLVWDWASTYIGPHDSNAFRNRNFDTSLANFRATIPATGERGRGYWLQTIGSPKLRLREVANVLVEVGEYRMAEERVRRTVKLATIFNSSKQRDPRTPSILENLALICQNLTQWDQAKGLLLRVSCPPGTLTYCAPECPDLVRLVRNLALMYRDRGDTLNGDKIEVMAYILEEGWTRLSQARGRLLAILRDFDEEVASLLMNRAGDGGWITGEMLTAAASNEAWGAEVVKLLLGRKPKNVRITEAVMAAAAANTGTGEEVMRLLLDGYPKGGDGRGLPKIVEEVMSTAAGNTRLAPRLLELFLTRGGDQLPLTENVLVAAAKNSGSGYEAAKILLGGKGHEIRVTSAVVSAAAGNPRGGEVMGLLLEQRREEVEALLPNPNREDGEVEALLPNTSREGRKQTSAWRERRPSPSRTRQPKKNEQAGHKYKQLVIVRNPSERGAVSVMLQIAAGI